MNNIWQIKYIELLENIFKNEKAILLVGSIVSIDTIDEYSDIDLKIIIEKNEIKNYFDNTNWIEKNLGKVFSLEKIKSENSYLLRICLEDFKRFDISLIIYEDFLISKKVKINGEYKILNSSIKDLESCILQENLKYDGLDKEWFEKFKNDSKRYKITN